MRIVTGSRPFIDIDAYAGIIAYSELLNLQGTPAMAASTSVLNASVTPTTRSWGELIATNPQPAPDDTFTLIDISNYDALDKLVSVDRVDEIIDHHPGFVEFWKEKIGERADIQMVGAACSLVFERWERAGLLGSMSQTSARLLICGLLDNTLNFKAQITGDRDHHAYEQLLPKADLPADWTAQYFQECQEQITTDPLRALRDDCKILSLGGQHIKAAQIVVWDANSLLDQLPALIERMAEGEEIWLINIIAIKDGRNHIVCQDASMKMQLGKIIDTRFKDSVAVTNRLWLRKELLMAAEKATSQPRRQSEQ